LKSNGKPYKELVKIAHALALCPIRNYPAEGRKAASRGAVMSYIDMVYLGLLLVAFLGFGAALGYCYRRQRRNPPTRLESKRFRRGENS
jgi:hypothetical protein